VSAPRAGGTIFSPLIVAGEARGPWFFEANAPLDLLTTDGSVIARGYVEAQGDWMTEQFVPFTGTLKFHSDVAQNGILQVSKSNPSGLPEHDASLSIPVVIADTQTTAFFVHFFAPDSGEQRCDDTSAVQRIVQETTAPARAALDALLAGPNEDERTLWGYTTSIPDDVQVHGLDIRDGVAYIDFNEALENGGGACRAEAIIVQITNTVKQFSSVDDVVISVNGRTEDILQP
jgi:hypothetical protein